MGVVDRILPQLARHPQIKLGILFGSLGRRQARFDSDLDLAVAADHPLDMDEKRALIEGLAQAVSRPVDWSCRKFLPKAARFITRTAICMPS